MPVRVHARRRVVVIAVSGALDLVSRPLLDAAVDSALAGSWRIIVVDLADLKFIDAAGSVPLRQLVRGVGAERLAFIVNAEPGIERVLSLLDLTGRLIPTERLPVAIDGELAELLRLT